MDRKLFYFIFSFCFLFGGVFQLLGILSYTETNILLLLLSCIVIYKLRKFNLGKNILLPSLFITTFLISTFLNSVKLKLWAPYILYIITPIIVFYFVQLYFKNHDPNDIFGMILKISFIQFPIIIFERLIYPIIQPHLPRIVDKTDIGFGSFFMASDHVLGLFLNLIIFTLLFYKVKGITRLKFTLTIFYIVLTLLILNTKISLLILGLILFIYFFKDINFKKYAFSFFIAMVVFLTITTTDLSGIVTSNLHDIFSQLNENIDLVHATKIYENSMGNRLISLYVFVNSPISWFGHGPFSTFNPYSKIFLLGGDFGQWLWFYNDLGIIGVLAALLLILSLINKANKSNMSKWFVGFIVIIYSFVFNSFIDFPFFFIIFYFSKLHSKLENQK